MSIVRAVGVVDDVDEEREVSEGTKHDEMVTALAHYLQKKRLVNVVRMSTAGYDKPRSVNDTVPDIEAVTSMVGQPVFGAAEECDTYALEESQARLDALSRVRDAAVFLVVPYGCLKEAKRQVQGRFPDRDITVLPYGKKS